MESINHQEDRHRVNSSDEEDDQLEQENSSNDVGRGRSYECMYCKRGFTTAQALGGHMNIHRKDRAKIRPKSSSKYAEDNDNNYAGPRIYQPVFSSYPQHYLVAHDGVQFHYGTYFPSTTPSHATTRLSTYDQNQHRVISPCGEADLRMGLSFQFGSSYGDIEMDQKKSARVRFYEEDHGLDLELRLGQHP